MDREFREALVHQARAVRLLAGFLQDDLPPLHWTIGDGASTHQVELTGLILAPRAGRVRAHLMPWAGHLGLSLSSERTPRVVEFSASSGRDGIGLALFGAAPRWRSGFGRRPAAWTPPPLTGDGAEETRHAQARLVATLGELAENDLPVLSWHVPDRTEEGRWRLVGEISETGPDSRAGVDEAGSVAREAVHRWGRFLEADPMEERLGRTYVRIRSSWKGTDIVIDADWPS
ncbi:hypothetical protein AB0J52_10175 [Spirillospora sp. NPDC049652]